MRYSITFILAVLGLLAFAQTGPRAQHVPPIGCQGVASDACKQAISALQDYLASHSGMFGAFPEQWTIASDSELQRIRGLYPTRREHWISEAPYALFLEPQSSNLHACAPTQVIVTPEAVGSAEKMTYIAGYVEGACEGWSQRTLAEIPIRP